LQEKKMRMKVALVLLVLAGVLLIPGCLSQPATAQTAEEEQKEESAKKEEAKTEEKTQESVERALKTTAGQRPGIEFTVLRVQFEPDSSVLRDSEKKKVLAHAYIPRDYPDIQLLITGHSARVGTEESCQILSDERARVVANFILAQGLIDRSQLTVKGMGSKAPLGDNSTEEGMQLNRRVEITVLGY
jgi:outer membrane protein OmpA-like peptidoglycan-associated protein